MNILSNAVKFTDRKGRILVLIEMMDNQQLRISVTDSGSGITKKDTKRLFKLFGSIKDEER